MYTKQTEGFICKVTEDSLKTKVEKIIKWATLHSIKINITVEKLIKNLDWVNQLFPEAHEEQEKFLREINPLDINRRFMIYHSLLELKTKS